MEPSLKVEASWDCSWEELGEAEADVFPGFGRRKKSGGDTGVKGLN